MDLLIPSAQRTYCPFKGNASYWSLKAGGEDVENLAWSYETPFEEHEPILRAKAAGARRRRWKKRLARLVPLMGSRE